MEKNYRKGVTAAVLCSTIWGLLPVYWKMLIPIPSYAIIFYRIFFVGMISFVLSYRKYGWVRIKEPLKDNKSVRKFILTGVIITSNWSIYIWAVNAGYVIQTSIGYYIEPLLICLFGIVFFSEKLTKYNSAALILATSGVIIMIVHFRQIPVVALALAVTFATYSVMKKTLKIESILSLLYETVFLVPVAIGVIIYLEVNGKGAIGTAEPHQFVLLALTGAATALPLALFNTAANNLPLVTLGVTQYVSPSLALILGIFVFGEPFDSVQFMACVIIWIGLVVFTAGEIMQEKKEENKVEQKW